MSNVRHMKEFHASPLPEAPSSDGKVELCNVHFDLERLEVIVGLLDNGLEKKVVFEEVCGFRVLDECDLSAWWSHINLNNGWCFEIAQGGWFEQESQRPDFFNGAAKFYREFLVIGVDFCISVISKDFPRILELNHV